MPLLNRNYFIVIIEDYSRHPDTYRAFSPFIFCTNLLGVSLVIAGDELVGVVHAGAVNGEPVHHPCRHTGDKSEWTRRQDAAKASQGKHCDISL